MSEAALYFNAPKSLLQCRLRKIINKSAAKTDAKVGHIKKKRDNEIEAYWITHVKQLYSCSVPLSMKNSFKLACDWLKICT